MQVETDSSKGQFRLSSVESAVLFEPPTTICARIFRELKPRTPLPEIRFEFRPFANARSTVELRDGVLSLQVADILQSAPAPVLESLVHILLAKLFRRPVPRQFSHRYRLWMNRKDVRRAFEQTQQARGHKRMDSPAGEHYDLVELFESINFQFFHGLLARPDLGWSRTPSKVRLGHYDPSHHAIVLSRALDSPRAPRLIVEYVMYHEMLHLLHPVEHAGSRRRVHTRAFREAEKKFPRLPEAKKALQEFLCSLS
jgi:hypothetical protein